MNIFTCVRAHIFRKNMYESNVFTNYELQWDIHVRQS